MNSKCRKKIYFLNTDPYASSDVGGAELNLEGVDADVVVANVPGAVLVHLLKDRPVASDPMVLSKN